MQMEVMQVKPDCHLAEKFKDNQPTRLYIYFLPDLEKITLMVP